MEQQLEDSALEVKRLRHGMNTLLSVMALPAVWNGGEPRRILETLLEALSSMLHLDFACARVLLDESQSPLEIFKSASAHGSSIVLDQILEKFGWSPSTDFHLLNSDGVLNVAGQEIAVTRIQMQINGGLGIILAGSTRIGFPEQTEKLILSVAANQTAVGLQQSFRLKEQETIARDLDDRVSARTAELAAANEELRKEISERIETEARLRASEDQLKRSEFMFSQVIDAIPTLAWSMLPDGPNEFLSKRWHEFTGLSREESHGWGWQVTFHPDDLPPLMERWRNMLTSGEPGEIEARIRRHDGVYRWFLIRCSPFHNDKRQILRWYGTSTDIEDRKIAEDALRSNSQNLSLIINTMPVLAWSALPDGIVDFFNQRWLDYTGLSPEQAEGWGWTCAIHIDDRQRMSEYWQGMIAKGTSGEIEARLRRFDGEYRWFLFRADPLRDDFGTILKWYGTNTDIDDRKRAEESLRLRELSLLQITETIPEMLWSATPDGAIDYCNGRLLEYTGFSTEDVMKDGWKNLLHPADMDAATEAWKSCVSNGTPYRVEVRTIHAIDHTYRWCVTSALPLRDDEGEILRWHGTVVDMHDWKQAQEELREAHTELARMMRVTTVGQLTASIAHEVSQPLSGIITNASACLRMLDSQPPNLLGARETTLRTIRDGNRASDVINRLRTLFSRKHAVVEPVDLNETAREVLMLVSAELQRNRVLVQQQLTKNLPPVNGDHVQLQQVILNLLRNAAEAMDTVHDRPRKLVVQTGVDEHFVSFSVVDSGTGIAPEISHRLFESFFTTKTDGMGIGLAVSRSIIEAHRGQLWATKNEGPGSTFSFSLPRDDEL